MILPKYLSDVAEEMRRKSEAIRRDFASHRPAAGENREDLVREFLIQHLPRKFGVSTGLIFSHDGMFSNQADLVVVDSQNNAPLHGTTPNKLWPVEAVYALIEVKTTLSPVTFADAVAKGRRFKLLQRKFCIAGPIQRIMDSLFVIWAFDGTSFSTIDANIKSALATVPRPERPDLIVIPGKFAALAGSYLELCRFGQPGSAHREQLHAIGVGLDALVPDIDLLAEDVAKQHALSAWYVWFDSWLRQAGSRLTDPVAYLPFPTT